MYENAAGLGSVAASLLSPWAVLQQPLWAKGAQDYTENAAAGRVHIAH
ncbi:MAG TPA: hypothetical protein PLQ01_10715 [Methanothrix sp.]|jgi:hypothetical protein|nr:hypothetical protein [Methanothrix sp.]